MKKLIGLALLLMFVAGVLFLAPASEVRASNLAMPQNDSMQSTHHGRRHHRRWHRRSHRRHHHNDHDRRMHRGNSNM